MMDLKETTIRKLLDPEFSEKVFKQAYDLVCFIDRQTREMAELLAQKLALDSDRELSSLEKEYSVLVSRLRFAALNHYTEAEIISFFKTRIYDALGLEEFSVRQRLKAKLLEILITERDAFKAQLREALTKNNQQIPVSQLVINKQNVPSTVQNWFRDYNIQVGMEAVSKVKQVQYFVDSPNFKKLSEEDKIKLKQLFNLFEWLKFSSLTPAGLEESITIVDENGNVMSMDEGRLVRLYRPVRRVPDKRTAIKPVLPTSSITEKALPSTDPFELLKQKYQVYRQQREPVLKLEDKILVRTEGDLEAIKRELATASRNNDKNSVVACVKILARQKILASSLKENQSWWQAVADYVEKKYTKQYKPKEIKQAISNLKLEPATPAILSEFLQYLLKEKLRLSENDSALVGVEIGQLLGGVYQSLAYGNPETGNFEWIKNKIENNKLVSEVG